MPNQGPTGTQSPIADEAFGLRADHAATPLEEALANARPKRSTRPRVRAAGTGTDFLQQRSAVVVGAPAASSAAASASLPAASPAAPRTNYATALPPRTAERLDGVRKFDNITPIAPQTQAELFDLIGSIEVLPNHGRSAGPVASPRVVEDTPVDTWLIAAVLGLLLIGTIEIFASTALSSAAGGNYFLTRQLMWLGIGGLGMWFAAGVDLRWLRRAVYPLLFFAIAALFAVLVMPRINGAKRWFLLGPLSFQPVEVAKLALIVYLAHSIARKASKIETFTIGFVPHLIVASIMMGALLLQPDLGSSVVIGVTTLGMLFIAGARISYIMTAILVALPVGYQLIVGTPWRMQRFLAYFNPEAFSDSEAYQFLQARIAMGSGGFWGTGLGNGRQSLGYMPEAHNDFILAPIGEELGFLGIAAVMALFVVLIWRGTRAALRAKDVFSSYLAFGITMLFAMQALFNAAVVLGLLPNKGITLPFVSYGGSSLLATMVLAGILVNVGRRRDHAIATAKVSNHTSARRRPARVRVRVL